MILCKRGTGAAQAPAVEDPLLSDLQACLIRGRFELDQASGRLIPVKLETVYKSGMLGGDMIKCHDSLSGESWRGFLVGVSIGMSRDASGVTLTMQQDVERIK